MDTVTVILEGLRVIFGFLVLLFVPGFVLSLIIFPGFKDVEIIKRLAYSMVLGIGSVIALVLFMAVVPGVNTQPENIFIVIAVFSFFLFLAWLCERWYLNSRLKTRLEPRLSADYQALQKYYSRKINPARDRFRQDTRTVVVYHEHQRSGLMHVDHFYLIDVGEEIDIQQVEENKLRITDSLIIPPPYPRTRYFELGIREYKEDGLSLVDDLQIYPVLVTKDPDRKFLGFVPKRGITRITERIHKKSGTTEVQWIYSHDFHIFGILNAEDTLDQMVDRIIGKLDEIAVSLKKGIRIASHAEERQNLKDEFGEAITKLRDAPARPMGITKRPVFQAGVGPWVIPRLSEFQTGAEPWQITKHPDVPTGTELWEIVNGLDVPTGAELWEIVKGLDDPTGAEPVGITQRPEVRVRAEPMEIPKRPEVRAGVEPAGIAQRPKVRVRAEPVEIPKRPEVRAAVEPVGIAQQPDVEFRAEPVEITKRPEVRAAVEPAGIAQRPDVEFSAEPVEITKRPEVRAAVEPVGIAQRPDVEFSAEPMEIPKHPEVRAGVEPVGIAQRPEVRVRAEPMEITKRPEVRAGVEPAGIAQRPEVGFSAEPAEISRRPDFHPGVQSEKILTPPKDQTLIKTVEIARQPEVPFSGDLRGIPKRPEVRAGVEPVEISRRLEVYPGIQSEKILAPPGVQPAIEPRQIVRSPEIHFGVESKQAFKHLSQHRAGSKDSQKRQEVKISLELKARDIRKLQNVILRDLNVFGVTPESFGRSGKHIENVLIPKKSDVDKELADVKEEIKDLSWLYD